VGRLSSPFELTVACAFARTSLSSHNLSGDHLVQVSSPNTTLQVVAFGADISFQGGCRLVITHLQ
jgi:hypothetical protein